MKAQRRRVLKQNTLAHQIENLPHFVRTQGPRILLGVAGIGLIVLLVVYRMNTSAKRQEDAQAQLARAQEKLVHLKFLSSARAMQEIDAAEIAHLRNSDYDEASQEIEQILANLAESDSQLAAQTYVAKGDLNWMMANLPPLPGAATQPAQSQADLLKAAEDAYNTVVEKYPGNELSLTAARFGLAGIAEDRQDWEKARNEYQAAIDDKKTPPSLVVQAQTLIQQDEQLVNPFMIGMATTMPTTLPSTMPATMPTTRGMDMNTLEPTTAPGVPQP